ncbi:hypothetical protein JCM8097_008416 [Rhodosporidiobolus ruineniae]
MYRGPPNPRSPPPLQHPRPQHPPSQIPSTSPPPDAFNRLHQQAGGYERFASPPVQPHLPQNNLHAASGAHHIYGSQGGGPATPDAYVPAGQWGSPAATSQQGGGGGGYGGYGGGGAGVSWMGGGADTAVGGSMGGPAMHAQGQGQGHAQQQQQQGGQGQQQGGQQPGMPNFWPPGFGGGGAGGPGGNLMNDATAQMGMHLSQQAFSAGQAYLDKNVVRLLPLAHLKHSFNVSNSYVVKKLRLVLWPWRHRPWSRSVVRNESTGVAEGWKPPRDDINCPDLYIPVMALVTYILLAAVYAGTSGTFDPQILGQTASKAFGLLVLEFVCIKLGCYLLGIGDEGTMVDLLAYEGYKFVGVIVSLLAGLVGLSGWSFWLVFAYTVFANFFFQLRSLRHLVLPDPSASPLDHVAHPSSSSAAAAPTSTMPCTPSHAQRARRIQFLFVIAAAQALSMGVLVRV